MFKMQITLQLARHALDTRVIQPPCISKSDYFCDFKTIEGTF
jgi:hypothetical protein